MEEYWIPILAFSWYARAERELSFANSLQPIALAELGEIDNRISTDKVADLLEPFLPSLNKIIDKIPSIIGDLSQDKNDEVARDRKGLFLAIGRVFHNYGSEKRDRQALEKAKIAYEAVLRFEDPARDVTGWTSAQLNIGDILMDLGGNDSSQRGETDLRSAVRTYRHILTELGDKQCNRSIGRNVWNNLGVAYLRLGLRGNNPDMEDAMLSLTEALKCDPDGGWVHYHIGVVKEYLGAHN